MKLIIDTNAQQVAWADGEGEHTVPLYTDEAFYLLSDLWVRVGWNQRYSYSFSWMGRPIIQLPEDMVRSQEVIYRVKPDVIIETGIAHGGSLIYYASLCKAMGCGRVIGVDIEIRPQNRAALEAHEMFPLITLVEGNSTDPDTIANVKEFVRSDATVLVILDSNHTKAHVLAELDAYHTLVTPGSYIVATDGIMGALADTPRGDPGWVRDNPLAAAAEFVATHPTFVMDQPDWPFSESTLARNVTHWPGAWLRRVPDDER